LDAQKFPLPLRHLKQLRNKRHAAYQERQARCKEGSRRWQKLQRQKNRASAKLYRQQRNILHQASRKVISFAEAHGVGELAIGDVRGIADGVAKGRHANQKLSQWPHGQFRAYLEQKGERKGMRSTLLGEAYSTRTCSSCGFCHRSAPRGRVFRCSGCGATIHRDANGAANICSKQVYGRYASVQVKQTMHRRPVAVRARTRAHVAGSKLPVLPPGDGKPPEAPRLRGGSVTPSYVLSLPVGHTGTLAPRHSPHARAIIRPSTRLVVQTPDGAGEDGPYNEGHRTQRRQYPSTPAPPAAHCGGDDIVLLYLFGSPRLEHDGATVPLRRSKALALLAYLTTTGRPHGREALLALLWPEFPGTDARNNLRRELSQLRAALGEGALVADRRQIAWGHAPAHWVDVAAFSAQIAVARAHAHTDGLCAICAGALAEAAQLASADLLDGYHLADSPAFEEWLFFQREELRQQLAWALEALAGWHAGRGELQPALTLARRWLSLDPLHEPPRRALMRLFAQAGQHAAALRSYEEGARLLASELGATPEPATSALYEAIKTRKLAPEPQGALTSTAAQPPPAPTTDGTSEAEAGWPPLTSFIGRLREIDALVGRLADPACRLLSLVGPGGIGKTRLAAEVAARCHDRFPDGVVVVPLAGATLPAHIPGAIAPRRER
jgi:IS605 OrfB family transposase